MYAGINIKTGGEVAVKLEKLTVTRPTLPYESKIYQKLQGHGVVPNIHWFGVEGEYSCLVMELLGPNLEQLFEFCDKQFTITTAMTIGL